jgi:hypothetical protein
MPAKPSWILQLPRIQDELEALHLPVADRACFERIFGVRRRRAIQLMHQFGGYQSGRTFFVERVKLLRSLRRIAGGDYEWELARITKLVAEIERTKKLLHLRHDHVCRGFPHRDNIRPKVPAISTGIIVRA